ncbi:MAG: mannose-6-phosphate isomerase [Lachnospiraceae bacterium]|nr:mannose-6-phosphate isomerase [Lachnospiraceae bacterium]
MKEGLLKLPRNRVRRNYLGGAGIDRLHGEAVCQDNDRPEEWIGSMVEAVNLGMEPVENEGLAMVETEEGVFCLRDLVDKNRQFYLGNSIHQDGSWQLSFLLKILDSAMRLHVQAHPSTQFANEIMGKPYGKLECYYILNVREGIEPYIRLGFQHAPERGEWKEIVKTQDSARMDACFEKIPVKPGEVWYIPGGMPHAIGEGITMLEIMEPSDLVVRCEFEREGVVVPEEARYMGRDLDFCLDVFDYTEYSQEDIIRKCRITPQVLEKTAAYEWRRLVGEKLTPCFFVENLKIWEEAVVAHNGKFTLGVVCRGSCRIEQEAKPAGKEHETSSGQTAGRKGGICLKPGDSFVIAAAVGACRIVPEGEVELTLVYPGKDMER